MSLTTELWNLTTTSHGMQLPGLVKLSGIKSASKRKADMIDALYEYLSNEANLLRIWQSITNYERELISEYIYSEGCLEYTDITEIMDKYKVEGSSRHSYSYSRGMHQYFNEKSKANLFFTNGRMIREIRDVLKKQVKAVEVKFEPVDINIDKYLDNEEEYRELVSIGETFEKDFISIIRLVNSSKFKVTKASGLPNKTAMIKMNEVLTNKEILCEDQEDIKDIRTIDKTIRLYGISKLLLENKILEAINGNLSLGKNSDDFLRKNTKDRCQFLLKGYIKSDVDELQRIKELKIKTDYEADYANCREIILKYIRKLPINEWIDMNQLFSIIKKLDRHFLKKEVGEIYTYHEYDRYYYANSNYWENETGRYIDIVLIEYLASMAIVDLVLREEYTEYSFETYFRVDYVRLTPFGAYILGVNNDYSLEQTQDETGIIIQPNYEIMVPAGNSKETHCIFLEKFAEKLSEDTVSIYKIDFKAMVRALDNNISIEDILAYFQENSQNKIPQNVLISLNQWNEASQKISIRTVTIVETNDKYLFEELKSYGTIKKDIVKELPYALEIEEKAMNKVKRNIEKKNHLCRLNKST